MKTRKILLTAVLIFALCVSLAVPALAASSYTTLKARFADFPSDWSSEALAAAVENGLLIGDNNGLLRPDDNLTRAEMAAVINRAWGCYVETDISQFEDVSEEKWYYEDIAMAVQMGTFIGDTGGTMRPDAPITRVEAIAVVARAMQLDLEDLDDVSLDDFGDADEIPAWAEDYCKAMYEAGYIQGDGYNLYPNDYITRAEFAQIFYNIISEYITESGEYDEDFEGNLLIRTDDVTLTDLTIDGDLIIGCGAADGQVVLSNVTITGRLVVWGGGADLDDVDVVQCNDGTYVETLIVCRVDEACAVVFDRDSTLAVYDTIEYSITDRAYAFRNTRVEFYDLSDIFDALEELNEMVADNTLDITMDADLLGLVDETSVDCYISNNSSTDVYVIEIVRIDTDEQICETITLKPEHHVDSFELLEVLDYGNYDLETTVTAYRDDEKVGQIILENTLHIAYLWAE